MASGCACCAWRVRYRRLHTTTTPLAVPSLTASRHQHHLYYRPHPRTTISAMCEDVRGRPFQIKVTYSSTGTRDVRAPAWWNCNPLSSFIHSDVLGTLVLIRRYPLEPRTHTLASPKWMVVPGHSLYCNNLSLFHVTVPHSSLNDSLLGGNNYTVRYDELAGSEINTEAKSLWRVQRQDRSNMFTRRQTKQSNWIYLFAAMQQNNKPVPSLAYGPV
jgi:hypothetical protein